MSKHTPGPWKAVYVGSSDWDLDCPGTEENFKLAAAAPELLEALKQIANGQYVEGEEQEIARAAIAKATGAAA
jgi:hypothetical protein